MVDGITVRILGDYGPFSMMGKSIGYQVIIGESSFLLDCGAPLFQQIGGHGLKEIKGLIITHCHDDHKRWFSDLALFNMYAPDVADRVYLLTSEEVHRGLMRASGPALETSLSTNSKSIVDIPYDDYIDYRMLGPRARYRIVSTDEGRGRTSLSVMDTDGNPLGPDRAKIVISEKTKRPRMLFKDPDYGEWVEPESFYPFSSAIFYETDRNPYVDQEGFTIEAIKAPVWHGVTGIGIRIRTEEETLVFSSDTAHDIPLWKDLCEEKKVQRPAMSRREFESSEVIHGDINDYVERIWSRERYREAVDAFTDAVVIHDISSGKSVVHTNYEGLQKTCLKKEHVLLTHSPDKITSEWALCRAEKTFRIKGLRFFEVVGDRLYPMNADVYHKEAGRYYAGYRREGGTYAVYEREGVLRLSSDERFDPAAEGSLLYRVDLYEDVGGRYFPRIEETDAVYRERRDGKVELIRFTGEGSTGTVLEDQRDRLV
jgi:ribonuclease BN (tRNA processing enzyme)